MNRSKIFYFLKVHETLLSKTTELERETAKSASIYMSTMEGKRDILNPEGHTPILKRTFFTDKRLIREVNSRISMYVEKVIQNEEFVTKKLEIQSLMVSFFNEICKALEDDDGNEDLCTVEKTPAKPAIFTKNWCVSLHYYYDSWGFYWIIELLLHRAFHFPTKAEKVDIVYDQSIIEVRETLQKESCKMFRKIIEKVMLQLIPRRLDAFKERIQQLQDKHHEIITRHEFLNTLLKQVKSMNNRVIELQDCLKPNAFGAQET